MPNNPFKVRFYVDGQNLYHGAVRPAEKALQDSGVKWLDLEKLLVSLVQQRMRNAQVEAEKIFLFTALVAGDHKRARQEAYHNALLAHSPAVEIVLGDFVSRNKKARRAGEPIYVKMREEKKTDVNIACQIVQDAYTAATAANSAFHAVCLVSRDRDMSRPLQIKLQLGQKILLIVPRIGKAGVIHPDLTAHIPHENDKFLAIPRELISACRLPNTITNKPGEKHKIPPEWQ